MAMLLEKKYLALKICI